MEHQSPHGGGGGGGGGGGAQHSIVVKQYNIRRLRREGVNTKS